MVAQPPIPTTESDAAAQTYSAEEFQALAEQPEYTDVHLELSSGELIVMSPTFGEHGVIAHNLDLIIGVFVKTKRLGYVTIAETAYVLRQNPDGKDTIRCPDVGFVRKERFPDGFPMESFIPGAPDLAVEVISHSDSAHEVQRKVEDYLQGGAQQIWLVYPRIHQIVIHTPEGAKIFHAADVIDGGSILPGFTLNVHEVFEE